MYWAKSSFLTITIIVIAVLFWEKCILMEVSTPPRERFLPPNIYLLLKGGNKDTREWLDVYDERPLLVNTCWNYFPSLHLFNFEKQVDYSAYTSGLNRFLRRLRQPMYEIPSAKEFVRADNLDQRLWTYYGRVFSPNNKQLNVEKSISIRWLKNGKVIHQKNFELPIKANALRQPCEGLMFMPARTEAAFYWESLTDNEELNLWIKNCIIAETKNSKKILTDTTYKLWLE